jgi:chemotaxis protein MotB
MKKDQIWTSLPQYETGKTKAPFEMNANNPLFMTDEDAVDDDRTTSRFSPSQKYRLTPIPLESSYLKSQPAPIHWAVGWADLMMTMFVVFLVMYLYQFTQQRQIVERGLVTPLAKTTQKSPSTQGDQAVQPVAMSVNSEHDETAKQTAERERKDIYPTDAHPDQSKMEMTRLYDLAVLTLRENDLAKFADIELSPDRTVRIILAADLLFPSGDADLGPTAREKIRKIAALLKKTPYMINVVGHTDNVPIKSGRFATNWELSVMRATTVARFLIEGMEIPASQFSVSGRSYYQPQTDNETAANRAKNRRVEIIVSREQQPATPIASNQNLL